MISILITNKNHIVAQINNGNKKPQQKTPNGKNIKSPKNYITFKTPHALESLKNNNDYIQSNYKDLKSTSRCSDFKNTRQYLVTQTTKGI